VSWPYYLAPLIPAAIVLRLIGAPDTVVFFASALGLIPPAALMGDATEALAARSGPGVGGILNVTFGNAPELIVALFALGEGLHEVVKASLVGSVVGNVLLVLGAAMLLGGRRFGKQRFETAAVRTQTRMLLVAAVAPLVVAAYALATGDHLPAIHAARVHLDSGVERLSAVLAALLIVLYAVSLRTSLREYARVAEAEAEEVPERTWSTRRCLAALAISGVFVGVMSEVLVHSIAAASQAIGLSQFFVGAIVVAIVGNAAEHWVAVLVAMKDKMDLAVSIAVGSSAQVALLVTPLLCLASFAIGPSPMPLVLNWLELLALTLSVAVAAYVTHSGRSTWREGAQLLALYAALAVAFAVA
jgi:Ca2+:H+ antiporter